MTRMPAERLFLRHSALTSAIIAVFYRSDIMGKLPSYKIYHFLSVQEWLLKLHSVAGVAGRRASCPNYLKGTQSDPFSSSRALVYHR